jgi:hypothetical protein
VTEAGNEVGDMKKVKKGFEPELLVIQQCIWQHSNTNPDERNERASKKK